MCVVVIFHPPDNILLMTVMTSQIDVCSLAIVRCPCHCQAFHLYTARIQRRIHECSSIITRYSNFVIMRKLFVRECGGDIHGANDKWSASISKRD